MFKKITICGNLGKDPEIRTLPGSSTIAASFSVACNETWLDSEGETQKRTTWFNVVAYQPGEKGIVTGLIQKWLRKGQLVLVEGDPCIRTYTAQDGTERRVFEIKLGPQSTLRMLGGKNGNGDKPEPNGHDAPVNGGEAEAMPGDKAPIPF